MVLAGALWFAGDVVDALLFAHRGPLAHLLLGYPSGRVRGAAAVVVAASYADGLVPALARAPWPTIALMAAIVAVAARRHRAAVGGEQRRARAAALAASVALCGSLALAAIGRLAGTDADAAALWLLDAAVAAVALGLAADLIWGRWTRAAVTGLVVDLGDRHDPLALRAALSRTLGEPALEVAYRVGGAWVDESGQPARSPGDDGRAVTVISDGGAPVAALVRDGAGPVDPELDAAVAAVARLAVANVRMQFEIEERVHEVAASRRRLVEAADDERRRLAAELDRGAQRQLAEIAGELAAAAAPRDGDARRELDRIVHELDAARAELRRFAVGVHPRALTEGGLAPALAALAAQSAVPVHVDVPSRRLPVAHEAAAYFICSEALANTAKHAAATRVAIVVVAAKGRVTVRVADDGAGGADLARGSGLRGLADRVEALGGRLRVDSPRGAGTRLDAELPITAAEDA
jgi:signal transduction histidine kinase